MKQTLSSGQDIGEKERQRSRERGRKRQTGRKSHTDTDTERKPLSPSKLHFQWPEDLSKDFTF